MEALSWVLLGTLPALKELRLTGNNLVALPVEMSMPYVVEGGDEMYVLVLLHVSGGKLFILTASHYLGSLPSPPLLDLTWDLATPLLVI